MFSSFFSLREMRQVETNLGQFLGHFGGLLFELRNFAGSRLFFPWVTVLATTCRTLAECLNVSHKKDKNKQFRPLLLLLMLMLRFATGL